MRVRYKMVAALSVMLVLSACGKGAPSKAEVAAMLKERIFNTIMDRAAHPVFGQGHELSLQQKKEMRSRIDKNLNIQNFKCDEIEGMSKVYKCGMILLGGTWLNENVSFRLIRKDDGKLLMEDSSPFD